MAKAITEKEKKLNKFIADKLREKGFPFQAEYIEMFGYNNVNPAFVHGSNENTERFYERCVKEGHSWQWYVEITGDEIF